MGPYGWGESSLNVFVQLWKAFDNLRLWFVEFPRNRDTYRLTPVKMDCYVNWIVLSSQGDWAHSLIELKTLTFRPKR